MLPLRSANLQCQTLRLHAVPCTSQVHGLSLLTYVALVLTAVELDPQLCAGLVLFQLALKYLSSGLEPLPQLLVDLVLPDAHQPKYQVVGLSDQYQILFCVMYLEFLQVLHYSHYFLLRETHSPKVYHDEQQLVCSQIGIEVISYRFLRIFYKEAFVRFGTKFVRRQACDKYFATPFLR